MAEDWVNRSTRIIVSVHNVKDKYEEPTDRYGSTTEKSEANQHREDEKERVDGK